MEVVFVNPESLRIKSKVANFLVGSRDAKEKGEYDALFAFAVVPVTEQTEVTFAGPGEFEVKGIKMTGLGKESLFGYMGRIENMTVCITKASLLSHSKDMSECDVCILLCDTVANTSQLANLSAKAIIVAGPESEKLAKDLQQDATPVNKFAVTKDKLPTEMQLVVLG